MCPAKTYYQLSTNSQSTGKRSRLVLCDKYDRWRWQTNIKKFQKTRGKSKSFPFSCFSRQSLLFYLSTLSLTWLEWWIFANWIPSHWPSIVFSFISSPRRHFWTMEKSFILDEKFVVSMKIEFWLYKKLSIFSLFSTWKTCKKFVCQKFFCVFFLAFDLFTWKFLMEKFCVERKFIKILPTTKCPSKAMILCCKYYFSWSISLSLLMYVLENF